MATVGIRELKARASEIVRRAERGERSLITKRGRAVAALLPFDEDLEDFILANAPTFIRLRERARREFQLGRTVPLSKLRERLRASARARARRAR